jgi:hypothetical protein
MEAAADAVEAAAEELEVGLKRLWDSPIEAAREQARGGVGKLVGRLDQAMERAAATCDSPGERKLLSVARDQAIRDAIGELLAACRWELRKEQTAV